MSPKERAAVVRLLRGVDSFAGRVRVGETTRELWRLVSIAEAVRDMVKPRTGKAVRRDVQR